MSQPSLYSPLRSQLREVRVIHLLPSDNFDHDIHCELRAVSLDTNPEYEALSYVWSTPPGTGFITVSGQPMEVTANLLAALRRLRCRQKTRVVWADAICINQADMDERCAQVLLMGDIYRLTKGVLIWLGDGLDGTREDALTVDERDDFPWRDAPMDASFI
ncbi:heterokaryon incompatibility protein-domain-containing protein, partial [Lasiosphaeris hirsuta]